MEDEYKKALNVFKDSVLAQQLLKSFNNPFANECEAVEVEGDLSNLKKLEILSKELKSWVILKSKEMEEFEGDDLHRIEGEAVGCMYAIRELEALFK
ncbi:hypothetical protein [Reinekea marinisedimentorum]|uniref:Uncharacterized protein n=1 Tax=Reinekea marinisedimentorum TaxID=230495 RepID=A0A4R3HS63_9GAMM|nr:hypothetical protein [Reinekea marinisedimentorum]TCS34664.1 hypothetical protein BCF53_1423 [Reinekea marinisedimentorum]